MKNFIKKYRNEIMLFVGVILFYSILTIFFIKDTTIFYDTNRIFDVVLDTDSGEIFASNFYALKADNSKHILFSHIVSVVGFPIFLFCKIISKIGIDFNTLYALALLFYQAIVSATSIVLMYKLLKYINVSKNTKKILLAILIVSYPQIIMTLSIERFIFGQLSLILFMYIAIKFKGKETWWVDLAAIPLFGITLTNIYLYGVHLITEYKLEFKKYIKHLSFFAIVSYFTIMATKTYLTLLNVGNTIEVNTKFISGSSLLDKFKMVFTRFIYPAFYFPGYKIVDNKMKQNSDVNTLFLILIIIVLILALYGGLKFYKDKLSQMCIGVLGFNLFLHGVVAFNLNFANIMSIHFAFVIFILLGYFSKTLIGKWNNIFNIFLMIILATVVFSNIKGFAEIYRFGVEILPR